MDTRGKIVGTVDVTCADVNRHTVGGTVVAVVRASVLDQDVEAVVNAANERLADGGGVPARSSRRRGRGWQRRSAGAGRGDPPGLAEEIRRVYPGDTATGTAVMTGGHGLQQPWIIHAVGTDCRQRQRTDHREKFIASYRACLEVADEAGLSSIAVCSISTGLYGCPLAPCATLAVKTVVAYLEAHPATSLNEIVFAMHGKEEHQAFVRALAVISHL